MRTLKQILIILGINFAGEFLSYILHLPLPGSITGMLLMLLLLLTGIIQEKQIAETADFFLNNMGFFFIPAGVSVMVSYEALGGNYAGILLVIVLSTLIVMSVTGLVTQFLIKRNEEKDGKVN